MSIYTPLAVKGCPLTTLWGSRYIPKNIYTLPKPNIDPDDFPCPLEDGLHLPTSGVLRVQVDLFQTCILAKGSKPQTLPQPANPKPAQSGFAPSSLGVLAPAPQRTSLARPGRKTPTYLGWRGAGKGRQVVVLGSPCFWRCLGLSEGSGRSVSERGIKLK